MINDEYYVVGVMSGTSLDGIDLVYAKFQLDKVWKFDVISAETVGYTAIWFNALQDLVSSSIEELLPIDIDYTNYLSTVILNFINKNNIIKLDAVCSHGHTALHRPEKQLTYQIGNKPILASLLNKQVVCNFRIQDVELGGQGAPLVPIGDKLLFSEYDFCVNLGGFANISTELDSQRIAFDICPVNIVLNYYVKPLGINYDNKGKIAASGTVDLELLNKLNALSFYKENPPKSLGLEWVNSHIFPLIDVFNMDIKDLLRTFVEHIAIQIALELNKKDDASVFITGGGAYNDFLIERIKQHSKNKIIIPSKAIVEFKEALIFGFLGVLKLRNEVNCLKHVTGALKDHSSGKIYLP